jgi:MFS family permease
MEPLQRDLGASKSVVVGAFSVALVGAGLSATFVGAAIDRIGGTRVMGLGSAAAGILLALLSRVDSVPALYALYAALGMSMAAVLYEASFAVLTQTFGTNARRAITYMTLLGGLASSVFWPITQQLIAEFGWRAAVLILAGINLFLCAPLHFLVLPRNPPRPVPRSSGPNPPVESKSLREVLVEPRFYWLCGAYVSSGLVFSALAVHMIPIFQAKGLSLAAAAGIAALVGVMQTAGRILELSAGRNLSIVRVGLLSCSLWAISILVLFAAGAEYWHMALFATLYGLSNGIMTIVRGALPAELFGRDHYGAVSGALATPAMFANASGPLVASLFWTGSGGSYDAVLFALAIVSLTGVGLLYAATRPPTS